MTGQALQPGDLNNLFENWVTQEEFKQYTPVVISSPEAKYGGVDGPWIITFDTFLTDYESDQIWEGGKLSGVGFDKMVIRWSLAIFICCLISFYLFICIVII
mgnify:CR=1 FL=1